MQKVNGTCMWFSDRKGFGFLRSDDGNESFVHYKNIKEPGYKALFRGQRLSYDETATERGTLAINVKYEKHVEKL